MRLRDILPEGTKALRAIAKDRAAFEARLLMSSLLEIDEVELIRNDDRELTPPQVGEYLALIERRAKSEPIAYLTGKKEFFGLEFFVTSSVLIPRPETELLVEEILSWIRNRRISSGKIVDLGTGSGAIACSLASKLPRAFEIIGGDVSQPALEVADRNRKRLALSNVHLKQIDLCQPPTLEDITILVSNPPYIPTPDLGGVSKDIRDFEPQIALDGGADGMKFYQAIFQNWWPLVSSHGLLALETYGADQRSQIRSLLNDDEKAQVWVRDCHLFFEKLNDNQEAPKSNPENFS